jgi:cytochrome o ubiquinol oxidase subunit 3
MTEHLSVREHHLEETYSKTIFGFWSYLMTDCILFGTLFATFVVLHNNTYGGPSGKELFSLPFVLTETLILLTSSFTCTLSKLAAYRNDKSKVIAWFGVTFLLGVAFIAMELYEFSHLVQDGHGWQSSAFLSAFFTLVATHGLHISTGLLWMIILIVPVFRHGLTPVSLKRLTCLRMFWHFLDIVWIFIFTIVYLMEVA